MKEQEEDLNLPDYMSHPIVGKYIGRMHLLIDALYAETDEGPQDEVVTQLKDVWMSMHRRICFDGELAELGSILRMLFPDHYTPPGGDSIPALTEYPLSTSN